MSHPQLNNWKAAVIQYLTSLLLSLGLSLSALKALLPGQALWPAAVLCAVFALAFQGLALLRLKRKWLIPLGILGALGLWGALGGGPVHSLIQLAKAAFLTLRGIPDATAPYADTARLTVCLLFSLLGAAITWDRTLPLAVFAVITVVGLLFLFSPQTDLLLCALPAAAGLLLLMTDEKDPRFSALPLAALLTALPFFLLPGQPRVVPQLQQTATQIRQFVEDYLLFNEYRASFSLSTEGYQPLEERLGGPALPENHTVMEVATDRTVLLRGRTYDRYNGLTWDDSLSVRRYLFASPRFTALKTDLFDLERPAAPGVSPSTLRVHLLNNGTTTLFVPAHTRTTQLDGERMVLYYNMAGEMFLTRNLQQGDDYALTYLPFAPGTAATKRAVDEAAGQSDPYYDQAAEAYLKLPSHIQQEIFDIAARAVGNAQTPYEKALNIQNYLRSHYRYNLRVQTPPEGVDFVAWFLIGEQEGYCTYFATAMTVLCRIAGLPARYVTGYLAVPDENGLALVTGKEAHAWTEVYLNGFGWLDFDATPRSDNQRDGENENGESPDPPPAATPTPPPQAPSPSPQPQEQPTPTPEPSEQPTDEPGPNGTQDDSPTPTPPPVNGPTPTPEPSFANGQSSAFPWWILLVLLALSLLVTLRFLATEPLRRSARKPGQAPEILFGATSALLARRGVRRRSAETLHEFARRADETSLPAGVAVMPLADALAAQVYGNHPADAAPFQLAYRALRDQAGAWTRLRLAIRRMLSFKR